MSHHHRRRLLAEADARDAAMARGPGKPFDTGVSLPRGTGKSYPAAQVAVPLANLGPPALARRPSHEVPVSTATGSVLHARNPKVLTRTLCGRRVRWRFPHTSLAIECKQCLKARSP